MRHWKQEHDLQERMGDFVPWENKYRMLTKRNAILVLTHLVTVYVAGGGGAGTVALVTECKWAQSLQRFLMSSKLRCVSFCPADFTARNVFCKETSGNTCGMFTVVLSSMDLSSHRAHGQGVVASFVQPCSRTRCAWVTYCHRSWPVRCVDEKRKAQGRHTEEHVAVVCTWEISKEAECYSYHWRNWVLGTRMDRKGLRGELHYASSITSEFCMTYFLLKIIEFLIERLIKKKF